MTERDVVLRERAAFWRGADWRYRRALKDTNGDIGRFLMNAEYEEAAAEAYPLPKITRPRVLKDPEQEPFEWAAINGVLKVRNPVAEWKLDARSWGRANGTDFGAFEPTPLRVRMWNDLLMNPTETVDA